MVDPHIVVVDDDQFSRRVLLKILQTHRYDRVDSFTHPRAVLESIADGSLRPDVFLCDLSMPNMDGIGFIESLAALPWRGSLIVTAGEGAGLPDAAVQLASALHINVLGALAKPVDPAALAKLLLDYTSSSPTREPVRPPARGYQPADLQMAIECGQFILHYQPIVRMRDGMPSAIEGFVRWRHPEHGLVYPRQFVEVATAGGLMQLLTEQVIQQALDQARLWRREHIKLPLSINLPAVTFQRPGAVDWLTGFLQRRGLDAEDVVWEITEADYARDQATGSAGSRKLREARFAVAIVNFGQGDLSLADLRREPPREIRIDRRIVRGSASTDADAKSLKNSAEIAAQLGVPCVAVGVETPACWRRVAHSGCTHAQGWVVARPQPAQSLASWLERWPGDFQSLLDT